jgi:hypothetical protein
MSAKSTTPASRGGRAATARPNPARPRPPAPTGSRRPLTTVAVGVGAVVLIALVIALSVGRSSTKAAPPASAADAASVIAQTTGIPSTVADQVGLGDAKVLPQAISGAPLTSAGKPEMLYIGAEYCPYCATERWAMVVALARFGTFSGLTVTHSSSTDVYANTPTFSFHGSTYSSPYLTFTPVETTTNQPDGKGGYTPLDAPTADQVAIWQRLDPRGGIPFVDIGGKTALQVASALADPTTAVSKAVVGTANTIVAAICKATNQQPASVCSSPATQSVTL